MRDPFPFKHKIVLNMFLSPIRIGSWENKEYYVIGLRTGKRLSQGRGQVEPDQVEV